MGSITHKKDMPFGWLNKDVHQTAPNGVHQTGHQTGSTLENGVLACTRLLSVLFFHVLWLEN